MFGAIPMSMIEGDALVWMLGTDELYRQKKAWALLAPRIIGEWLRDFRSLSNIVSADNHRAITFLSHFGFHVGGRVQHHRGEAFVHFHRERAIQRALTAA